MADPSNYPKVPRINAKNTYNTSMIWYSYLIPHHSPITSNTIKVHHLIFLCVFCDQHQKMYASNHKYFFSLSPVHLQTSTFTDSGKCASMSACAVYFAVGILVISYTVPLWEYLYSAFVVF